MVTVFANLKGGCGKSTVTFNLGIWLANRGIPVTAYDLDPQRSLEDAARVREEEGIDPPLEVLPPTEPLGDALRSHRGEVLVDVGAADRWLLRSAVQTADRVVMPVPPGQADVWAAQRFLAWMRDWFGEESKPRLLAFLSLADTHQGVRESEETEEALSQLTDLELLPNRLCQRAFYRRSFSEGLGVNELKGSSKAAGELSALAEALHPEAV